MNEHKDVGRKKPRISRDQVTEIRRLFQAGTSITEIAKTTGIHRHTVRMHLKEQPDDTVANEVRRQVLTQALVEHFKELKRFAEVEFKEHLDASLPEEERTGKERGPGPINTRGLLGLPFNGSTGYMTAEWQRMYQFSARDDHLVKSLREHTKDSTMWVYYDAWKKKVAAFERASRALWQWTGEEMVRLGYAGPQREINESVRSSAFGWILFTAWGVDLPGLKASKVTKIKDFVRGLKELPVTPAEEAAILLLGGVERQPEWSDLKAATQELRSTECQNELQHIMKQLDDALVSIELMYAFPGHCGLCPV